MNYLKRIRRRIRKFIVTSKRTRRKIHNFGLKTITMLNVISFFYWVCWIDAIISWQPYLIMAINFGWICLFAYANGYFYDTKPYYERMEEHD